MQVQASFVEIYNETIQDLLVPHAMQPSSSSTNLPGMRVSSSSTAANNAAPSTPRSVSSEGGGSGFTVFGSSGSDGGTGISIRETGKGEIVLEGATEKVIKTMQDIAAVLEQGNALRATAAHK